MKEQTLSVIFNSPSQSEKNLSGIPLSYLQVSKQVMYFVLAKHGEKTYPSGTRYVLILYLEASKKPVEKLCEFRKN